MCKRLKLRGSESGQSIVIVAMAMVAIIAMAALVLDGGYAFLERRRVQNAADAAALAGVRSLAKAESETAIRRAIDDYAVRNGIVNPSTNVKAYFVNAANEIVPNTSQQVGHNNSVIPAGAVAIVVQASEQHNTFFAQAIGFPTIKVAASAQAAYSAASTNPNLLPLAVPTATLKYDQEWTLWDTTQVNGQRDWLNFDTASRSASELSDWMCNGFEFNYGLPVWIGGTPGTKTKSLDSCNLPGRVVFVPMYDTLANPKDIESCLFGSGMQYCYRIIGFGAFRITEVTVNGSEKKIQGTFIRWVMASELGGPFDMGTLGYRLTRPVNVP